MSALEDLNRLRQDVRRLRALVIGAFCCCAVALFLTGYVLVTHPPDTQANADFDRITARRIDIVEPDGVRRLVLTSAAATPGPIIDGREGVRNFPFSGLMLYDREGDEIGGYGSGSGPSGDLMIHTMDFGQSEALASFRRLNPSGSGSAGIFLSDQPPLSMPSREATQIDWTRIRIHNPDKAAEILLNDSQHRPRIRLMVDAEDRARIEVLDPEGRPVFSVPDR